MHNSRSAVLWLACLGLTLIITACGSGGTQQVKLPEAPAPDSLTPPPGWHSEDTTGNDSVRSASVSGSIGIVTPTFMQQISGTYTASVTTTLSSDGVAPYVWYRIFDKNGVQKHDYGIFWNDPSFSQSLSRPAGLPNDTYIFRADHYSYQTSPPYGPYPLGFAWRWIQLT